jgi:hypothetical protein
MGATEVIRHFAWHAGIAKPLGKVVSARFGPALKFADHNTPVIDVMDDSWLQAVQTHETKTAENLPNREQASQLLLIAETVLQRNYCCPWADQRRQETRKLRIGSGFKTDQHYVTRADFVWRPGAPRVDAKITLWAANENAVAPHRIVVRTQQEMDISASPSQLRAVEAADCSTANDGNLHDSTKKAL